jgi:serine protease Do
VAKLHLKASWRRAAGLAGILFSLVVAPLRSYADEAKLNATSASVPAAVAESVSLEPVFTKSAPENVADLLAIEKRVQSLTEKLAACTVAVRVGPSQGSGVIVSKDGYVLTAAHVIGVPGRPAVLILADGRQVTGKTLGLNRKFDAALIKITDEGEWPFADMADFKSVKIGDWCLATGHPGGYHRDRPPVVRLGRVILTRRGLVQTDCTLVGGDSGGPLFDMHGRVIGIHSRIGTASTWNFHVPVSAYTDNWEKLVVAESTGAAILGVTGDQHDKGCLITGVAPGLPAEKVGLEKGDVIVKFDGQKIKDFEALADLVFEKKPGDSVTLELLRGSETIEKTVVLAQRPE